MSEYWQTVRSFSPSLRRFYVANALVTTVAFGMMAVLLNLYLLRLGFDARYIGLLAGLGQLVWAAAALPAGLLSNRIGLRNNLQLGMGLFGLAISLILLVESRPETQWRAWLLGCQVLLNIGVALITVNIPPYLMAVTGERERRHAFAFLAALVPASAFLGSVVAGILPGLLAGWLGLSLAEPAPYRMALSVAPILCWLGILPLLGADPGRVVKHAVNAASPSRAPLGLLAFWAGVTFLAAIGEGAIRTFFNVYLDMGLHVAPATIGVVMGVAQLLPIVVALSLPLLMARWGTGYTLIGGIVGMAACMVPIAVTAQVWVAALGYMAVIATFTVTGTTRDLFGQELVTPRWRTSSQGVAVIGMALGWSAAGVVGGILIEAVGFSALYLIGSLTALLAAVLLLGFLRTVGRRQPVPTESTEVLPER